MWSLRSLVAAATVGAGGDGAAAAAAAAASRVTPEELRRVLRLSMLDASASSVSVDAFASTVGFLSSIKDAAQRDETPLVSPAMLAHHVRVEDACAVHGDAARSEEVLADPAAMAPQRHGRYVASVRDAGHLERPASAGAAARSGGVAGDCDADDD